MQVPGYLENVDALKKLFFSSGEEQDEEPAESQLGLHLNLPLARWSAIFLPTQQILLKIFL